MIIIPKQLEPKIHFIITAATLTATLFLLGFIVFYYAVPTIIRKSSQIEETKVKLAALEEAKSVLLAEEEKIKSLSTDLGAIDAAIVPINNPVAFLGILEQLARKKNLTIEIVPVAGNPNASPNTLMLNVSVTGAMKQGIEFMKNISNLPFIITLSDVTLSRNITVAPTETTSSAKTTTPILGETTLTMTLLVAGRP